VPLFKSDFNQQLHCALPSTGGLGPFGLSSLPVAMYFLHTRHAGVVGVMKQRRLALEYVYGVLAFLGIVQ
jgi:hypothetical protein